MLDFGPPMPGMMPPKKKRKGPTPESLVLKAVIHYLALCRLGKVRRNNVGMIWAGPDNSRPVRFGTPGEADLTLELAGSTKCVHVECKAPGGRLSPHQTSWLADQASRGHICIVAYGVEEVYAALTAAGYNVPVPGGKRKTA